MGALTTRDGLMVEEFQLFAALDDTALQQIRERAVTRKFSKNTIILTEGDETTSLYLIESGRVKFFLSDDTGQEVILNFQGPGEYFGELSLLDGAPRSVSVMTQEPTTLSVVSRDDFFGFLRTNPDIALELLQNMAVRMRELSDEVRALALSDVYGRVKRLLTRMARESEDGTVVTEKMTHQQISQMVGASREMVSRIMKDLVNGGYIQADGDVFLMKKPLPRRW